MFVSILPRITNYFFALNQQNYARWMVKYHENLLKLTQTHPALYQDFKKGLFGIKITPKAFSRILVDLSLEQTINVDAASQQKGKGYLTDSIVVRQKWAESHFLRMSVISDIYLEYALTGREDIINDLRHYKIHYNNDPLNRIMAMVKETLNPLNKNIDKEKLYNLGTGKAVSSNTEEFMFSIKIDGENLR